MLVRHQVIKDNTIKQEELLKLFKEHNIGFSNISKHEIKSMMILINESMLCSYEWRALEYPGYI